MGRSQVTMTRRQFLKAGVGAGVGLGGALALGINLERVAAAAQGLKIAGAKEVPSVCPYCAVGCGTLISVIDRKVVNIEGNPDSPINRGTLCPKGAATFQLAVNPNRQTQALYRRPGGTAWEPIELGKAMDMIAERVKQVRDATWVDTVKVRQSDGSEVDKRANHSLAVFSLGGATMDNEWNYVHLKLMRGLGFTAIENQARI